MTIYDYVAIAVLITLGLVAGFFPGVTLTELAESNVNRHAEAA